MIKRDLTEKGVYHRYLQDTMSDPGRFVSTRRIFVTDGTKEKTCTWETAI